MIMYHDWIVFYAVSTIFQPYNGGDNVSKYILKTKQSITLPVSSGLE